MLQSLRCVLGRLSVAVRDVMVWLNCHRQLYHLRPAEIGRPVRQLQNAVDGRLLHVHGSLQLCRGITSAGGSACINGNLECWIKEIVNMQDHLGGDMRVDGCEHALVTALLNDFDETRSNSDVDGPLESHKEGCVFVAIHHAEESDLALVVRRL